MTASEKPAATPRMCTVLFLTLSLSPSHPLSPSLLVFITALSLPLLSSSLSGVSIRSTCFSLPNKLANLHHPGSS